MDEKGFLEEDLQEIFTVLEFDEKVTIVQSANEEILAESKPLGQVAPDVLERGPAMRGFGNDGVLERLAGGLNLVDGEESRRLSRVGEGGRVDLQAKGLWRGC